MKKTRNIRKKKKRLKRMEENSSGKEIERRESSKVVVNGELRFLKEFGMVLCVLCCARCGEGPL